MTVGYKNRGACCSLYEDPAENTVASDVLSSCSSHRTLSSRVVSEAGGAGCGPVVAFHTSHLNADGVIICIDGSSSVSIDDPAHANGKALVSIRPAKAQKVGLRTIQMRQRYNNNALALGKWRVAPAGSLKKE